MGFRIDKSWANIAPVTPAKRKEQTDAISALNDRNGQGNPNQQQQEQQQEEKQEEPSREALELAIEEMKGSTTFTTAGLKAEIIVSKDGISVRLTQATGVVVRVMSGSEFMKLHAVSKNAEKGRGSILDRKY